MATPAYEGWAIVELFGHVRLAGKVSQAEQYGTTMLRLDVPDVDGHPGFTSFKGGSALYSVTPTTEEIAIGVIRRLRPEPVSTYDVDLRARLPAAPPPEGLTVDADGTVDADDREAEEAF